MSGANDFIAGCVGGMAGLVVGHPFDTTKVQMQTQQVGHKYKGTMDAIRNISSQGMNRGFFRGMGFPLLSYGFINSVFFGVYGHSLNLFRDPSNPDQKLTYSQIFIAGAIGGAAQLSIGCPVDVVKVVLQAQIPHGDVKPKTFYNGPWECTKAVYRQHGFRGMYLGNVSMAVRDIPGYGLYLWWYEWTKDALDRTQLADKHGMMASFLAGGFAGTTSWAAILPFDIIKSRMQADVEKKLYKGFWDCTKKTYQEGGIRVFGTGLVITSLRGFPVNAVTFLFYEQTLHYLNKTTHQHDEDHFPKASAAIALRE